MRFTGRASGSLDRVFELDGVLHIVEAKGGSGRLGSRELAEGFRAQQGTAAYVMDVLINMSKRGGEDAAIAEEILKKVKKDPTKVKLWVTTTGGLNTRAAEPLRAKLIEVAFP